MDQPRAPASTSTRFASWLSSGLVITACAGIIKLGVIPVVVAGLLAWGIGSWLARVIEKRFQSGTSRTLVGAACVITMFVVSVLTGLLVPRINSPSLSSPDPADPAPRSGTKITLEDLENIAREQNRTTPVNTSPSIELTNVSAGPDMKLTYKMRILADGVTFTQTEVNGIRLDAIREGCNTFKAGLGNGITYVMAYHNSDGSKLVDVPITIRDCP